VAEGSGGQTLLIDLPEPLAAAPARAPAPRASAGPLWPAVVAFGAGGATLGVGAVAGALALRKSSEALAPCTQSCPRAQETQIRGDSATAMDLAHVSTAAFVVAGAAVAGGVVLLVVRPGGGSPVEARVGLGRATVRGAF
jgi:hypothetical protein